LVNFERQRVLPRTLFDLSIGKDFRPREPWTITVQCVGSKSLQQAIRLQLWQPFQWNPLWLSRNMEWSDPASIPVSKDYDEVVALRIKQVR
jgi:hypothetical protein